MQPATPPPAASEDASIASRFTRPPSDPRQWFAWARTIEGGQLLVLRAFLGVTFCFAGLQKLANRAFFEASNPAGIQSQLKASARSTPIGHLLAPTVHIAVLLGVVIAFGELAVGIGTLLGLYSRVAATGGLLLALSFFLTVSWNTNPYYYGPDIVFVFAWTPLIVTGAGALSLDEYFARLRRRRNPSVAGTPIDRRMAAEKLATGALVGGFALFFGGVSAAAGRVFARSKGSEQGVPMLNGGGGSPTTTTASGGGGGSVTTTSSGSSGPTPKGKLLGDASEVPLGGAAGFNDPFRSGIPAYCVQPKPGEFLAFSAVCTHAGCTVQFVKANEQFACPCHGSIYSAVTGDVIQGPAPSPLPAIHIVESSGKLYVTD